MEKSFNNLAELRAEIGLLKIKKYQLESAIQEKFDGPGATLKSIVSLFKAGPGKKSILEEIFSQDLITNVSRFILPIMLNGSIFRKSGFFTKTLVALFSQKAAKNINMDVILHFVDKIKDLFKNKGERVKPAIQEFGIPPDSETY